ncbi:DUF368 domain-containing protein [Pseudoclavibacter sp. Marseille-Q4354]|nr:DUF368 domain-containing protein [Pseudoclavibacter sp. Marseille-Q4354]
MRPDRLEALCRLSWRTSIRRRPRPRRPRRAGLSALNVLVNLLRGALIGVTEIIPGVSGGTIALLIGVYETLIDSAGHLVRGVVRAAVDTVRGQGLQRAREHFAQVRWGVVLPIGIGMLVAIVAAARIVAPLVEAHPVASRALFAGLIAVSLIVPARMLGARWQVRDYAIAVPAAILSFVMTGLPSANNADPSPIAILVSAAVAVCALVLPGVSGSFVLVTTGMYEPTLRALNSLDFGYIALFAVGAVTGLALFVQVLLWLLTKHRRVTLALMTGLMAGSLRALWPWQTEDRELLWASGDVVGPVLWFLLGAAIVAALLIAEGLLVRRALRKAPGAHPTP